MCACYKWAQRQWSRSFGFQMVWFGLVWSSQIYLGSLEPVKQINVILQISICSEGKTGSPLHRCVLHADLCVFVHESVSMCVCGALVSTKSDNNVYSVATSIWGGQVQMWRFTQSAKICVWSSNIGAPAHPMLTMCSFIHPSHLDEGLTDFVLWFILSLVCSCLFLARRR